MATRSAVPTIGSRVGVSVKAAIAAQADQDRGSRLPETQRQLDRIIASVEDEQGYGRIRRWQPMDKRFDLLDSHSVSIFERMHTLDVEWGGPAIAGEAELGDPLVSPAGDNGLPSGVAGRVIIEASLGAGFGVAAGPNTHIDGIDGLLLSQRTLRQCGTEGVSIDLTVAKGRIQTAPAATMGGFQAQVDERGQRSRCEDGLDQVEQRVPTPPEAGVQGAPKVTETGEGIIAWQTSDLAIPAAIPSASLNSPTSFS